MHEYGPQPGQEEELGLFEDWLTNRMLQHPNPVIRALGAKGRGLSCDQWVKLEFGRAWNEERAKTIQEMKEEGGLDGFVATVAEIFDIGAL